MACIIRRFKGEQCQKKTSKTQHVASQVDLEVVLPSRVTVTLQTMEDRHDRDHEEKNCPNQEVAPS